MKPDEIPFLITMKVDNILQTLEDKDFFVKNPFVPKEILDFELNFEFASKYEFSEIELDELELSWDDVKRAIGRVYNGWTDCLAKDGSSFSVDENGNLVMWK